MHFYLSNILWRMSNFTPRPLYPHRMYLGMHWIGGWLDSLAGMDATSKRKIGFSAGKQNPMYKNGPLQVNYRKGIYSDTSNPQLHVL